MGNHFDIYYGQIARFGVTGHWEIFQSEVPVANLVTGEGLPLDETRLELVTRSTQNQRTRLFDVGDECLVYAEFDPTNHVADYRYAIKHNGRWVNYSVCIGGLPFHGLGSRNYYGGMAINARDRFCVSVAREDKGTWFAEEYRSSDYGCTWRQTRSCPAPPGMIIARPVEECLSENASGTYIGELTSLFWEGIYDPDDYSRFFTDAVSLRHPKY